MDNKNIKGADAIVSKCDRYPAELAAGVHRGLVKAGLALLRASQKIVPVDTGNLRSSGFTRAEGTGWQTKVSVGYTASYAVFVHENLENRHKKGKKAKFLEEPARTMHKQLQQIIRDEVKKGIKK
jgi:hypothetical protein